MAKSARAAKKPTPSEFEEMVSSVARALWNQDGGSEHLGGTNIDGVYRTWEVTHLVEATIEKSIKKVRDDVAKMKTARPAEERSGRLVQAWMVVYEIPSPDQKEVARTNSVNLVTFDQFRQKLINAERYVKAREDHRFGSANNPITGDFRKLTYTPVGVHQECDDGSVVTLSLNAMMDLMCEGRVIVVLGEYGTGKSITLREAFKKLASGTRTGGPVPLAVNLREHWGQSDGAEVLHRHARIIGFDEPEQLVRAWRGGRAALLLDGFDELAMQSWSPAMADLSNVRRLSVACVADFIKNRHSGCGVLVAGREEYFNSRSELRRAFGLPSDAVFIRLRDLEFSAARDYVAKLGYTTVLPDWVPRRPLFLTYLVASGLLEKLQTIDGLEGPAIAWRSLIDRVCEREAEQAAILDADVVKSILERLASFARTTTLGIGPIMEEQNRQAFRESTGYDPQADSMNLLMRLPGLTARNLDDGSRFFVDVDFLSALSAGDVVRSAVSPRNPAFDSNKWNHPLSGIGVSVAWSTLRDSRMSTENVLSAATTLSETGQNMLAMDLLRVAQAAAEDSAGDAALEPLDCRDMYIAGAECDVLDLETVPLKSVSFMDCLIHVLRLPTSEPEAVRIIRCTIERVEGASSAAALPSWVEKCDCLAFDEMGTTAGIMRSKLSEAEKVALTILKKLYVQSGHGRTEGSLFRGLDQKHQMLVKPVLAALVQEELAVGTRKGIGSWMPVSDSAERALGLVAGTRPHDPMHKRLKGVSR